MIYSHEISAKSFYSLPLLVVVLVYASQINIILIVFM